jgi:hypothetical protein
VESPGRGTAARPWWSPRCPGRRWEWGVPEPLAVEEHERLDGVLVEVDALVGVADGDVDGEVVGERGGRGEGEACERGRVGGGGDHVRTEESR